MQFLRLFSKQRKIELRKNRELRFFCANNVEAVVTFQMKQITNSKCRNCANDNDIFRKCVTVKD